jgi:hypothetical protein
MLDDEINAKIDEAVNGIRSDVSDMIGSVRTTIEELGDTLWDGVRKAESELRAEIDSIRQSVVTSGTSNTDPGPTSETEQQVTSITPEPAPAAEVARDARGHLF